MTSVSRSAAVVLMWLTSAEAVAQRPVSPQPSEAEAFLRGIFSGDERAILARLHSDMAASVSEIRGLWERATRAGGELLSLEVGSRTDADAEGCEWTDFAARFERFPARVTVGECPEGGELRVSGFQVVPESLEGKIRVGRPLKGIAIADVSCSDADGRGAEVGRQQCDVAVAGSDCVVVFEEKDDSVAVTGMRGDCAALAQLAAQQDQQRDTPSIADALNESFGETFGPSFSLHCDAEALSVGERTSCSGDAGSLGPVSFEVVGTSAGPDLTHAFEAMLASFMLRLFSTQTGVSDLKGECRTPPRVAEPECRIAWGPAVLFVVRLPKSESLESDDLDPQLFRTEIDWSAVPKSRRELATFVEEFTSLYARGATDEIAARIFGRELWDEPQRMAWEVKTGAVLRAARTVWGEVLRTRWKDLDRTPDGARVALDVTYEHGAAPLSLTILPGVSGLDLVGFDPHFESDPERGSELLSQVVSGQASKLLGIDVSTFPCSLDGLSPSSPVDCALASPDGKERWVRVRLAEGQETAFARVAVGTETVSDSAAAMLDSFDQMSKDVLESRQIPTKEQEPPSVTCDRRFLEDGESSDCVATYESKGQLRFRITQEGRGLKLNLRLTDQP